MPKFAVSTDAATAISWTTTICVCFFAALLLSAEATCEGQCVQNAKRDFGTYDPTPGTHPTLTDPLGTLPQGSVLKMITLGDSVVWGNGNIP